MIAPTIRRASAFALLLVAPRVGSLAAQEAPPPPVASKTGLVVSVSAPASDLGAAILAKGGNAVDAAVATAFALAVTHPSAGNIGGGGFMIVRTPAGDATTFDYRERAPLKSTPTMYLNPDGTINRAATASGWLAPGVPGTVRGMEMAHKKFGKLPWADVVRPAAELALNGWPLSPALARALNNTLEGKLGRFPSSRAAYSKPGGGEWQAGDLIKLPDLGRALMDIATRGPDVFYTGWIADSIDSQMRANGGIISKADLAAYRAVERAPVKGTFLGYEIVGMGPPSSGGTVIVETLNLLERLGVQRMKPTSAEFLHVRIEAARRAYLDRARYLGDADFVQVPLDRLLSKGYADSLARTIDKAKAARSVDLGSDIVTVTSESEETTHFSVVDANGMAVSNTYTLEAGYGSGVVIQGAGFLLNNEMGDFNKKPGETNTRGDIGTPANLIEPGKRMLSSMSPVIVSRNGSLVLVTGSPGGRTIPNTVLDVMLGVLAFKMDVRQAVDAPRLHHQWLPDTTSIEAGGAAEDVVAALRAMGHRLAVSSRRGQGDAHSITYDGATKTAYGAHDTRSSDSRASKPDRE
ncbi:MAG TPA: gamma-glutamyltransferase [Gemmatimonadaceae bacterium]|nr:gamma-glutamyltransferase [Gemmatimonadaceae bacterium]